MSLQESADSLAEDVEYGTSPLAPDLVMFTCPEYGARLSTVACAKRWSRADRYRPGVGDPYERCRGCPLGARHAGRPQLNTAR